MKHFIFLFKILVVWCFVVGIFRSDLRIELWAIPAGWAFGLIIGEWTSKYFFRSKVYEEKIFDSRYDNVPPEVKQKLDEVFKMMIKKGIIKKGEGEKCKDPHCPSCWGFGDEDKEEPKI